MTYHAPSSCDPRHQAQTQLRDHIRQAITDAGLTQADIAADLGITEKHLSYMLCGRSLLTLAWAERVATLCGRRVVVLVIRPENPNGVQP